MSGCCFIKTGGEIVDLLKSVFNVLFGLLALIFVYALKIFFLITSFIALIVLGYSFSTVYGFMGSGEFVQMLQLMLISLSCIFYLYATTLLGVGMTDIISLVNAILQLKNKSTANDANSRMGKEGVFKR